MEHHNEKQTGIIEEHLPPHHEGSSGSLLEIDGTIVFIAISFVLFTVVMQRVFYGPLTEIREKRKQHINSLKNEADDLTNKSEGLTAQYTEKIKAAKKKASENTAKVMSEANQEKNNILAERNQQVTEFLQAGRGKIQQEKTQSVEDLQQNIEKYSDAIFRKVMGEELTLIIGENNERNN